MEGFLPIFWGVGEWVMIPPYPHVQMYVKRKTARQSQWIHTEAVRSALSLFTRGQRSLLRFCEPASL